MHHLGSIILVFYPFQCPVTQRTVKLFRVPPRSPPKCRQSQLIRTAERFAPPYELGPACAVDGFGRRIVARVTDSYRSTAARHIIYRQAWYVYGQINVYGGGWRRFVSFRRFVWWVVEPWRCRGWFVCGYGRDVLPSGLFPPRDRTEKAEERPCPPYQLARSSACCIRPPMSWPERLASRRIATVMTSSSSRRARCGEHGRRYDRLGARRWRHLDIDCTRLPPEHAPVRVTCAEHGVTVAMVPWARRKSAYTRDFERQVA